MLKQAKMIGFLHQIAAIHTKVGRRGCVGVVISVVVAPEGGGEAITHIYGSVNETARSQDRSSPLIKLFELVSKAINERLLTELDKN